MQNEELINSVNHRGCGIRAASYAVGPESWLPEACVSLQMETGTHKLWLRSFAHCFDAEKLTFRNKLDADSWALGAARTIIDRALEEAQEPAAAPAFVQAAKSDDNVWGLICNPVSALRRFNFLYSH
jgi:hypothetical protein